MQPRGCIPFSALWLCQRAFLIVVNVGKPCGNGYKSIVLVVSSLFFLTVLASGQSPLLSDRSSPCYNTLLTPLHYNTTSQLLRRPKDHPFQPINPQPTKWPPSSDSSLAPPPASAKPSSKKSSPTATKSSNRAQSRATPRLGQIRQPRSPRARHLSQPETIAAQIKTAWSIFSHINVLLINAGMSAMCSAEEATDAYINNMYTVNLFSPMHVTQAMLPYFRAQKSGIFGLYQFFVGVVASSVLADVCFVQGGAERLCRVSEEGDAAFGHRVCRFRVRWVPDAS